MENKSRMITVDEEMKVLKLKVKVGTMLYNGRVVLIYESTCKDSTESSQNLKKILKSTEVGIVRKILIKEGDVISPGAEILELEKKCNHPTVIKDLCAECGADLQKENVSDGNQASQASVSMVHMVPELKVNDELAQILGKADMDRLLEHKKLVLLVDLDQTLIHTTNDNIPNNIKDVYHFQLYGSRSPWYHTRLRPGTHSFLKGISEKYELHICTFGSRRYAHTIAGFLDPDGKYFSHRILSRDECFDSNSKTANLRALFPCGESMVCIIDDREDVWDYASNLIHVKPYHFFQHTGDIHAPPGLTKCEDDEKQGIDFSQLGDPQSNAEPTSEKVEEMDDSLKDISQVELQENCVIEEANIDSVNQSEENESPISEVIKPDLPELITEVKEEIICQNDPVVSEVSEEIKELDVKSEPPPAMDTSEADPTSSEYEKNNSDENIGLYIPYKNNGDIPVETPKPSGDPVQPQDRADKSPEPVIHPILGDDGMLTIEETDDYLLYLEEILKVIHKEFFTYYEKTKQIPDLKEVVPKTRATVLDGVRMVFSGIVPNRIKLEDSQPYKIARSLGAKVTQNMDQDTTHLVALRAGTAKVHAAFKRKHLKIVTPEWLWTCAERWEKVDERMFPLKNSKLNTESRHPPAHCKSPEHPEPLPLPYQITNNVNASSRVGGSFLYSINPLMSLSSEDIETMEGEVEDMFKESEDEPDDTFEQSENDVGRETAEVEDRKRKLKDSSSSSEENEEYKKFSKRKKLKKCKQIEEDDEFTNFLENSKSNEEDDDEDRDSEEEEDDETINTKFRRGESLPSDLDMDYNTEEGTEEDQESDGEWNVMGAALEREFLEGE